MKSGTNNEPGHSLRIFSAKFVRDDENLLITGGWDKNVKIWDVRSGEIVRNIVGPFICGDSIDIFENVILTGSYTDQKQISMYEFGTGKLI